MEYEAVEYKGGWAVFARSCRCYVLFGSKARMKKRAAELNKEELMSQKVCGRCGCNEFNLLVNKEEVVVECRNCMKVAVRWKGSVIDARKNSEG